VPPHLSGAYADGKWLAALSHWPKAGRPVLSCPLARISPSEQAGVVIKRPIVRSLTSSNQPLVDQMVGQASACQQGVSPSDLAARAGRPVRQAGRLPTTFSSGFRPGEPAPKNTYGQILKSSALIGGSPSCASDGFCAQQGHDHDPGPEGYGLLAFTSPLATRYERCWNGDEQQRRSPNRRRRRHGDNAHIARTIITLRRAAVC